MHYSTVNFAKMRLLPHKDQPQPMTQTDPLDVLHHAQSVDSHWVWSTGNSRRSTVNNVWPRSPSPSAVNNRQSTVACLWQSATLHGPWRNLYKSRVGGKSPREKQSNFWRYSSSLWKQNIAERGLCTKYELNPFSHFDTISDCDRQGLTHRRTRANG